MLYGIKWDLYCAFDFQRDVAEHCDHIFINDEEYDFNYPGRSGHNFIAETNDEQTLRKEIRSRLAELLWTDRWKVLQYRRRQEAEEQERKNRRPTNSLLLCKIYKLSVDLTLTLTPTPVEYHIELLGKPSLRYRLWVRDRQYWNPTECFAPVEGELKEIGKALLRKYFVKWPKWALGHSAGEVLSESDLEELERE